MKRSPFLLSLIALAAYAQTAAAQVAASSAGAGARAAAAEIVAGAPGAETGTVEFGLFGHFTYLGQTPDFPGEGETVVRPSSRSAGGLGGRLGVFLTPTWSLELDAAGAKPELDGGGSATYRALSARVNYNFTTVDLADRMSMLVGLGMTRTEFKGGTPSRTHTDWGVGAIAGARVTIAGPFVLRGDVVADYIAPKLNLGVRAGVSVLLGTRGISEPRAVTTAEDDVARVDPGPDLPPEPPAPPTEALDYEDRDAALAGVDTIPLSQAIFFDYDQVAIRADAIPVLERKVRWLEANPRLHLRIEGHADDRGQDEYNLSLSQRRAAETQSWLVARGISAERLPIVGYGEEYRLCIQDPMTEPCHQLNRRSDFRILRVGAARLVAP
ncbi:MAG TPA: OmpA family protein [Gemmatimonadaceae bacterium]|nr:OmpA family protein [Gemmatimonadaceae bacterium]